MSIETLTAVVGIVSVLATLTAGFAWTMRRMDALEERLSARIYAVDEKLSARIYAVGHEVVEVKIAVARLEGPRPRLITGR